MKKNETLTAPVWLLSLLYNCSEFILLEMLISHLSDFEKLFVSLFVMVVYLMPLLTIRIDVRQIHFGPDRFVVL